MNETDARVAQRADAVEAAVWREMYAAAPAALPQWLERRAFTLAERRAWVKMCRGTASAPAV